MANKKEQELPEFQEDPEETLEASVDPSAEETFIEDDDNVATMEVDAQEDPDATLEAEFDPEAEAAPITTSSRRPGARRRPGRRGGVGAGRKKVKDEGGPGFIGGVVVFFSIVLMVAGVVSSAVNISEPGERELWLAGGLGGAFLGLLGLGCYFDKWGNL